MLVLFSFFWSQKGIPICKRGVLRRLVIFLISEGMVRGWEVVTDWDKDLLGRVEFNPSELGVFPRASQAVTAIETVMKTKRMKEIFLRFTLSASEV